MTKTMYMRTSLVIFLAMTCAASAQTTIYVDDDNCPTPGTGSLVDPFCSIQDAIDASVDTDTIEVAPGTYNEAIDFIGKAITLRSTDGPATTIIDATRVPAAGETVSVVKCVNGETQATVLDGFTMTGGTGQTTVYDGTRGGGVYILDSNPTITNSTFRGNSADFGGGIMNSNSSPTVTNCKFSGNTANWYGGGIYNAYSSSPTFTNCEFNRNNATKYYGGGMFNWGSSPMLINCTFSGNTATNDISSGGGIYNAVSSNSTIINCILWGNRPNEISNSRSSLTIAYSDIEGSGGSAAWNSMLGVDDGGNIDADPLFADADGLDNTPGTADDDLSLSGCSPAIDAGENDAVPIEVTTDLQGNLRFVDDVGVADTGNGTMLIVDMGALERQDPSTGLGVVNIPGDFPTIQEAINNACTGAEIVVAAGTYSESINFHGKAITLRSSDPTDPDVVAATIIDATGIQDLGDGVPVVRCISGETAATVLDGFTITGGTGDTTAFAGQSVGGGMYNNGSSPTVTNCTFSDSSADHGGGMYNYNSSSPVLTNCTFSENTADSTGGGMFNDKSIPTLTNCKFRNNTSSFGGGLFNDSSSPTLTNCTFGGNTAFFSGGGVYNDSSNPTLTNCLFSGNTSIDYAGGMFNYDSSPTLTNCTLSRNAAQYGSGMTNLFFSSPILTNCILWDDSPDEIFNFDSSNKPVISYSDIEGSGGSTEWDQLLGLDGGGNIDDTPLFVDSLGLDNLAGTDDDNLRLMLDSPAINRGFDPAIPFNVTTDLDGAPRIVCNRVDMGAYEHQTPLLPVHNITTDAFYCTIQECIDVATSNQECVVPPGQYDEAIDLLGKAITVRSSKGAAATIIDATNVPDFGKGVSVVRCVNFETTATVLDGFTITGGTGDTTTAFSFSVGGGMFIDSSSPTVSNCTITRNTAGHGGGMYNQFSSSPTVTNCTFSKNIVTRDGGGMYNTRSSSPKLANCTFSENKADDDGGGMYNGFSSNPIMSYCVFNENMAPSGGGMYNDGSIPTLTNCMFSCNSANNGSGMYNSFASPNVTKCSFNENVAAITGGGMFNIANSSPMVTYCTFNSNSANAGGGGGMSNNRSSPSVSNCMFSGNTAAGGGGGMGIFLSSMIVSNCVFSGNTAMGGGGITNSFSSSTITNCTFSRNTAIGGGGIFSEDSNSTVDNCILWGNIDSSGLIESAQIRKVNSTTDTNYSVVQGGWSGMGGTGVISADPRFIDPLGLDGIAGTDDDDLRLSAGSPCIDAGDYDAYLTTDGGYTDLDGKDRIFDDTNVVDTGVGVVTYLDMGAYETGLCHADGIYDYSDLSSLNECLTGPASSLNLGCACVDLEFDEQIDLRDFAQFQLAFTP